VKSSGRAEHELPNDDLVPDKIEINRDMLHTFILNRIGRQVNNTDIVLIDKYATETPDKRLPNLFHIN
jgi:hypothetical protein